MKPHRQSNKYLLFLVTCALVFLTTLPGKAQLLESEDFNAKSTSISESQVRFTVDPGSQQSHAVEVFNNSSEPQRYRITYQDFELTPEGKTTFLVAGSSAQSLSKYLSITPEQIEVAPGQTGEVTLSVSIPEDEPSGKSAWGVVMIEPVEEKVAAMQESADRSADEYGFLSTLGYGIWLYQNPSCAENTQVDITNFIVGNKERNKGVFLKVKNKGEGISIFNAYVEITNLTTGDKIMIEGNEYTILPGTRRTFMFELAEQLPKGSYSAKGVIDYKDQEEMAATKLEFKID